MILEKDKNLNEETARHWNEIFSRAYRFDRNVKEAAAVSALTVTELLEFYDTHFSHRAPGRRKMVTWVHGNQFPIEGDGGAKVEGGESGEGVGGIGSKKEIYGREIVVIEDCNDFKRCMPLLPLRKPVKMVAVKPSKL